MVDNFGTPGVPPSGGTGEDPAAAGSGKSAGFLSTTLGKIIVGGVALLVLLGAIGAIAMTFFFGKTTQVPESSSQPTESSAPAVSEESSATERPADDWQDTFAFRNIFQPTMKIKVVSTSTSSTTDGTDSETEVNPDIPADTLYLAGVSTVDGEPVAKLQWNGQIYTLSEGESIPDTPWKVLSISGNTVVMLYGDSRVTLTVGQGITK